MKCGHFLTVFYLCHSCSSHNGIIEIWTGVLQASLVFKQSRLRNDFILGMLYYCKENLSSDKKSWWPETYLYLCLACH